MAGNLVPDPYDPETHTGGALGREEQKIDPLDMDACRIRDHCDNEDVRILFAEREPIMRRKSGLQNFNVRTVILRT